MIDALSARPVTTTIGAVIEGKIDLREPLRPEVVSFLRRTLFDRGAIFFRSQDLSDHQMESFAAHFGTPIVDPFPVEGQEKAPPVATLNIEPFKSATAMWHSDTSFVPEPPSLTVLRAVQLPPFGGDTCWSSMYAAYEALSAPMRQMLDGLSAFHSMVPVLQQSEFFNSEAAQRSHHVHPLVLVHPETERKALFYNEQWCTRIVELTPAESIQVMAMLREHVKSPDFQMRWSWQPNDVAVWDNRSVQHYAVPDYTSERTMQRTVIQGDRPRGPTQIVSPT